MPAHLRELPKCRTCGKPATHSLVNGMNAPTGEYCDRHARMALKDFQQKYERESVDG
jgi:hypothetical protein